jgi:hypothetical protein
MYYVPCVWYQEEGQRQYDEQAGSWRRADGSVIMETPKATPFLTVTMPNNDIYEFDICLIHGEIRALGKKASVHPIQ